MQNLQQEDGSKVYSFDEWVASYPETSTQRLYSKGTQAFLRAVYKSSDGVEVLAPRYINEMKAGKRSYFKDLLTYVSGSREAPTTLVVYTSIARSFLLYCCDIEMNKKEARMLKGHMPKGTRPRTHKDDITREILRAILSHCDVKMKALVLLLLSSGIRVGEALQLKLSDVPLDTFPQVVNVRGEYAKEGDSYRSYISTEAKEALVEWLKVREEYIKGSAYRIGNLKERKFRPWTVNSFRVFSLISGCSFHRHCPFLYPCHRKSGLLHSKSFQAIPEVISS
jgi:integrase